LMLAETIEKAKQNPKGWLISEKLDGVRCYWDGAAMWTRNKKPFYAPDWFIAELPKDLPLDGELFTARDDFQNAVSIVRKQDKSERWRKITYMVYDAPLLDNQVFEDRLKTIEKTLDGKNTDIVKLHYHTECID
jgi:DNA ligase-1